MKDYESLSHARWECKYHIVFVPKYRKKVLYGEVKHYVGEILKDLAKQKGMKIEEGHLCSDHVHMMISIPPKYSVSMMIGFLKGKSAIRLHQKFGDIKRSRGKNFWARGYFVSTVGLNEEQIRKYIENQEKNDKEEDEGDTLDLGW